MVLGNVRVKTNCALGVFLLFAFCSATAEELGAGQVHLHPSPASQTGQTGSRPAPPQYFNPATFLGSGTANSLRPGAPAVLFGNQLSQYQQNAGYPSFNFLNIPPSAYFTSPFDYEADDAANPTHGAAPDTWFERVGKTTDTHKRAYNAISHGMAPRMGYHGTGIHRPVNPLLEAQELSDIDPWRHLAIQRYAMFRSPARNPEMRGQTLRRLQKSEVTGFDHTNGQYGVPLGTGIRGIGSAGMGLSKFDYGPFGMGPMHPMPLFQAAQSAMHNAVNQMAAPIGTTAVLGFTPPIMPFS